MEEDEADYQQKLHQILAAADLSKAVALDEPPDVSWSWHRKNKTTSRVVRIPRYIVSFLQQQSKTFFFWWRSTF